jgi:hypothetical protein
MPCPCEEASCDYKTSLRRLRNNISKTKKKNKTSKLARLEAEREDLKKSHAAAISLLKVSSKTTTRRTSVEVNETASVTRGVRDTKTVSLTRRAEDRKEHEQKHVDRLVTRTIEERPDGSRVTREEERAHELSETTRHSKITELKLAMTTCTDKYVRSQSSKAMKLCFEEGARYTQLDFMYREPYMCNIRARGGFYEFVHLPWVEALPLYRAKWDQLVEQAEANFPLPTDVSARDLTMNKDKKACLMNCLHSRGQLICAAEPHLKGLFEATHTYVTGAHDLVHDEFVATLTLLTGSMNAAIRHMVIDANAYPLQYLHQTYGTWWLDLLKASKLRFLRQGISPSSSSFDKAVKENMKGYPSVSEILGVRLELAKLHEVYPKDVDRHLMSGGFSPSTVQRIHDQAGSSESKYEETAFLPCIGNRVETAAQFLRGKYTKLEFVVGAIHGQVRFVNTQGQMPELKGLVPVISPHQSLEMGLSSLLVDFVGEPRYWMKSDRQDGPEYVHWMTVAFVGPGMSLQIPMPIQYWASYFEQHHSANYPSLKMQTEQLFGKLFVSWTKPIHNVEAKTRIVGYDENKKAVSIPSRLLCHPAYKPCLLLAEKIAVEQREASREQTSEYVRKIREKEERVQQLLAKARI